MQAQHEATASYHTVIQVIFLPQLQSAFRCIAIINWNFPVLKTEACYRETSHASPISTRLCHLHALIPLGKSHATLYLPCRVPTQGDCFTKRGPFENNHKGFGNQDRAKRISEQSLPTHRIVAKLFYFDPPTAFFSFPRRKHTIFNVLFSRSAHKGCKGEN